LKQHHKLNEVDVILTTGTFQWACDISLFYDFHCVVVDESHLMDHSIPSYRMTYVSQLEYNTLWCVTGTPCGNGDISILERQPRFLGIASSAPGSEGTPPTQKAHLLRKATDACWHGDSTTFRDERKWKAFCAFVDQLKLYMIKRSKDQQIKGTTALALPESTTTTVYLDMSQDEQRLFNHTYIAGDSVRRYTREGMDTFTLERCFEFRVPKENVPHNEGGGMMEAYYRKQRGVQEKRYRLAINASKSSICAKTWPPCERPSLVSRWWSLPSIYQCTMPSCEL
jgi:hypothetical protein